VDGNKVGSGRPGPLTNTLISAYRSEVQRHV
jgi:hypothetical protein